MEKHTSRKMMSKNLKPFKPGQSGNPLGARVHDKTKKRIKVLTKKHLDKVANFVVNGNYTELEAIIAKKDTPIMQLWFARVVQRGIAEGDPYHLNVFLDRVIGKVPDKVQTFSIQVNQTMEELKKLTKEELIERSKRNLELLTKDQSDGS